MEEPNERGRVVVKVTVVIVLVVSLLAGPVAVACGEPYCDWALWSGKFVDWFVCMTFSMLIGDGYGDWYGNWYT